MPDEHDIDLGMTVRGFSPGQKVFGRYVLVRLLGRGGMGVVWLAQDEQLKREIALKFLPELVAADPTSIDDLKRETSRSLELTHPHIVRVYDFITDGALAAISMEFVPGSTLAELRLQQSTRIFEPAELTEWVDHLCDALAYAHVDASIVHRDLKPSNLMIDGRRRLKVTDFGIAASVSDTVTRVTRVTSSGGTPAYASPQQIMGEAPSPADDIYAMGATLFELLTSKPPFYSGNLLLQVQTRRPPTLAARRTELRLTGAPIPSHWEDVIAACLEKDPAHRPSSAREVASRLADPSGDNSTVILRQPQVADDATVILPRIPPSPPRSKPVPPPSPGLVKSGDELPGPTPLLDDKKSEPQEKQRRRGRPLVWLAALAGAAAAIALAVLQPWKEKTTPASDDDDPFDRKTMIVTTDDTKLKSDKGSPALPESQEFTLTIEPPDASNVRVEFGSRSGLTPVSGVLRIPDLPNADYDVTVRADGFQPVTTQVRVGPGLRAQTVALTPLRGRLEVVTSPGASVSAVDADGNETPLGVADTQGRLTSDQILRAGRHTVRLEADGRESVDAIVEVAAGRTSKITRQLRPMPGEIRIITVPSGAEIRVNGVASGTTPANLRDVPAEQPLQIAAFLDGYRSVEQEVTLKPQERRILNLGTLPVESGALSLRFTTDEDLDIDDVSVTIDGQKRQPDSKIDDWEVRRFSGLKTGRHSVRVSHPDYETWTKAVEVSGEEEAMVEVSLVPKSGTVAFVSTPAGAQVVVESEGGSAAARVDGLKSGRSVTPLRRTLPAGDYSVRFSLDGYGDEERSMHVAPNQTVEVTVDLQKLFEEEHDPWRGPQSELVRFDHWNGLISFSHPPHWMAQPPAMPLGNTYTVSDLATQAGAQVYEVPGTNQPQVAVKLIAQAVGQYGSQVYVQETRAYGSAVFFKGTTVGGGGHVTWVGLFHAVPGGVIGLTVGCPSVNFGDNQALFDQILGTVRFPQ